MSILHKLPIKQTIIVFAVLAVSFALYFLLYISTPVDKEERTINIEIPKGASFRKINSILQETGVVKHPPLFHLLAIIRNATGRLKAGEYEISSSQTLLSILDKMIKGEVRAFMVTIPEDFTIREIAARLNAFKLIEEDEFFSLAYDQVFLRSLGIKGPSLEGFMFPNTYKLDRTMGTKDIIQIMVGQFFKSFTPEMKAQAKLKGFDLYELVTLASIIGKESSYVPEKPLVSAVFHNRLKKGMKLQSDPTAVYKLENFSGTIRRRHLRNDSPHNTYKIDALPPTPIANPGLDSLHAALYPAQVHYLYFVSKNDGTHHFSSNLKDHNRAVYKYQISRK